MSPAVVSDFMSCIKHRPALVGVGFKRMAGDVPRGRQLVFF